MGGKPHTQLYTIFKLTQSWIRILNIHRRIQKYNPLTTIVTLKIVQSYICAFRHI